MQEEQRRGKAGLADLSLQGLKPWDAAGATWLHHACHAYSTHPAIHQSHMNWVNAQLVLVPYLTQWYSVPLLGSSEPLRNLPI